VRLQRVLLLRQLGLGLEAIREVLRAQDGRSSGEGRILTEHLSVLRQEHRRIADQIGAVERTIAALDGAAADGTERDLMEEKAFEGFDHTRYRDEVEERWGRDAYARSDAWWRGLDEEGRRDWKESVARLSREWTAAAERGEDPSSSAAQELAARHVEWLRAVPGTPAHDGGDLRGYVLGLGEMYVADERFAANYGGVEGAIFVRDALRVYFGWGVSLNEAS
jgi:DNA-binding transcriptional MerR regulator